MAFGLNQVQLIGVSAGTSKSAPPVRRQGRQPERRHRRILHRQVRGRKVDKAEWHRVVSFQDGVVDMLERHARKGRLVYVQGKLQTTKWQDANGNDRYTTEIIIVPGGRIQFMDKTDDRPAPSQPPPPSPPRSPQRPQRLGPDLDDENPLVGLTPLNPVPSHRRSSLRAAARLFSPAAGV